MKQLLSGLVAASMAVTLLPATACAADYTESNATLLSFSDAAVTAAGKYDGYEIDGTQVAITEAGTYVFSGSCADGTITVKKEVTGVTLVLDGLTLSSTTTSPITINKSAEASLLVDAGSQNTVSDSVSANDESAAIKVKTGGSLTLGGTGTLTVTGNYKNGIKGAAESTIAVDELALDITAVDDGLSCDNVLTIAGGTLDITAGGDAIKASPDVDDATAPDTVSKGDITITGGTFALDATGDGIQADGALTVSDGAFTITTNGGHETTLAEDASSCKGLKSTGNLTITGGSFTLDTADDALHTNSDLQVTGGTFTLATGDDALHADNALTMGTQDAGTGLPQIAITDCYEGLEGTTVTIYDGDIDVTASDDGVNAANSDIGERSDLFAINIYGGDLYVEAGADGLDSNHDILLADGTVEVYGANTGGDTAIDCDGTFTLDGGTLLGAGMPPTAGTQAYVLFGNASNMMGGGGMHGGMGGGTRPDGTTLPDSTTLPDDMPSDFTPPEAGEMQRPDGTTRPQDGERPEMPDGERPGGMEMEGAFSIQSGSTVTIQNADGQTLYTATAVGSVPNVIFTSADVTEGETYTLLVDGEVAAEAEAVLGTATSSMPQGQPTSTFQDVSADDWFAQAVAYVSSEGLMSGESTNTFAPNASMTRGMLATVLYRLAGQPETTAQTTFADVTAGAYYADAVAWAAEQSVIAGTSDTAFSPEQAITREQLAAMLYRYAGSPATEGSLSAYTDAAQVSAYAEDALCWCVENGILTGTSTDTLSPQATATRAEVAAVLQRMNQA